MNISFRSENTAMKKYMLNEEQIHSSWGIIIFMLAIMSYTFCLLLFSVQFVVNINIVIGCFWLLYAVYVLYLVFWIYYAAVNLSQSSLQICYQICYHIGQKMRAKRQKSLKKDRNRSFSRFDTILVKKDRTVTERGEKGALKNANLGRERQNQTRSRPVPGGPFLPVPRGPFLPAPRDAAPHDAAPHVSTERSTKRESSRLSSF